MGVTIGNVIDILECSDRGLYTGFERSSSFCSGTMRPEFESSSNLYAPMTSEDYDCPNPANVPDWNNKFYNPLCRGWYKDQKKTPFQTTMTDLYEWAQAG